MCAKLGASRSGYYEWRNRPESSTAARREELKTLIAKIFEKSDSTYGYRRVHAQLRRWDVQAGPELVRRLMRDLDLVPCQPKPRRFNLTKAGLPFPVADLVGRDFTAEMPGEKMVGDITYIPTGEGWLYLATVIDCCTKEVIGYAMDDHYQTPLISRAIKNAARSALLLPAGPAGPQLAGPGAEQAGEQGPVDRLRAGPHRSLAGVGAGEEA
jgi:transposase InsO family protein